MSLSDDVDLEVFVMSKDDLSGKYSKYVSDMNIVCTYSLMQYLEPINIGYVILEPIPECLLICFFTSIETITHQ